MTWELKRKGIEGLASQEPARSQPGASQEPARSQPGGKKMTWEVK